MIEAKKNMKIILWDVEKERNKLSKRNLYLILKEIRNLSFSHLKKKLFKLQQTNGENCVL